MDFSHFSQLCPPFPADQDPGAGDYVMLIRTAPEMVFRFPMDRVGSRFVNKPTNTNKVNNDTLSQDPHLVLDTGPSADYLFELEAYVSTDSTADFKGQMVVSNLTGAFLYRITSISGDAAFAATSTRRVLFGEDFDTGLIDPPTLIHVRGAFQTSASAGTISFWWAQNTANGTPTSILARSWLSIQRLP